MIFYSSPIPGVPLQSFDLKKTKNKLIFIGKQIDIDPERFISELRRLRDAAEENDDDAAVSALHEIVPTFVTPEEFGFSNELMAENNIPLIVCGHVGLKGFVKHTEMAHIFKQTEDGLFMFSRFWMGEILKSRLVWKPTVKGRKELDNINSQIESKKKLIEDTIIRISNEIFGTHKKK